MQAVDRVYSFINHRLFQAKTLKSSQNNLEFQGEIFSGGKRMGAKGRKEEADLPTHKWKGTYIRK
jgi:hypothetical protein